MGTTIVLRAPMRARTVEAHPGEGAEHGLEHGVVAIGEPLSRRPATLGDALDLLEVEHGAKAARMVERLAGLPPGAVVWTRGAAGVFHRGTIAGRWFYDGSAEARRLGLVHARPVRWEAEALGPDAAPAAVVESFARGGRNLQAIRGA